MKSILKDTAGFRDGTIVALLNLKEAARRYIAPVTVVVLQHRDTNEKTVAIYLNGTQQRPETEALQRLLEANKFQLPPVDTPFQKREQDIHIPSSLPEKTAQEIHALVQREYAREEIQIQVEANKIQKSATQDAREREELEARLQQLQAELRAKEKDIDALRKQLRPHQVEFLRTEQHRAELIRAIRDAKEEVIIISPWMNRVACDDSLCQLIGAAISRGVRIRIGYGMGHDRNRVNAKRHQHNANEVKNAIKKYVQQRPPFPDFLDDIVETTGTHQKMLVCDRQFAITGSFNWLSYVGKLDEEYRQELSVLFRHSDQVKDLANIALNVWSKTASSPAGIKNSSGLSSRP